MIKIIMVPVGLLQANCYIVHDDTRNDAVLIDPGDDEESIRVELLKARLSPKANDPHPS